MFVRMPCVSLCLRILLHSEIICIYNCHEEAEDFLHSVKIFIFASFLLGARKKANKKESSGKFIFLFHGSGISKHE